MSDGVPAPSGGSDRERARRRTSSSPRRSCPVDPRRCWSSEDTVKSMKPGSVIVDLAVEQGGNCALVERDRIIVAHDVRIVGLLDLPALLAADASALYARNVLNFLQLFVNPATGALEIDRNDEIIAANARLRRRRASPQT